MSGRATPEPAGESAATLDLDRVDIGFSAAHFSIVAGRAERLHGHNYRVRLRAHGTVSSEGTVVDFHTLKTALHAECAELDERMLIPTSSNAIRVREEAEQVEVHEGRRRFSFPRGDVQLLAITNTTCECLAAFLLAALRRRLGTLPVRLELSVEEVPGKGATVSE